MRSLATVVYFQLKYCERCGGLWLRPAGTATSFCPRCEHIMADFPLRARRPTRRMVTATGAPAAPAQHSTDADAARPIPVCVS